MQGYIIRRLFLALVTVLLVSMIVFGISHISGDPLDIIMPEDATQAEWDMMRKQLGLDKPIYMQYLTFITGAVQGDLGKSIRWNRPCMTLIKERFPATLQLVACGLLISWTFGILVGMLSAIKPNGFVDRFGKIFAMLGQAMPNFWIGILFILLFAVTLGWLPTSGRGGLKHLIMPSFTLGWFTMAAMTRMTRSSMLDVLDSEFIKMTRIKGLTEILVIGKHALKNAIIPVLTLGALQLVILLSGAVITETIFSWPGMGRLMVDAVFTRDYPLVQACVLVSSTLFVATNLIVDLVYGYVDPRIRYQ
jgi:peptide/nickel transport system permease protein